MAHELLQSEAVIPNLPLTIECITGYRIEERSYRLFISTKEGHLLVYKVTTKKGEANSKLERTIKSKQKIDQLDVFYENGLLLVLQDKKFCIKDLNQPDEDITDAIERAGAGGVIRNVSRFSLVTETIKSSSGACASIAQLCLAQKKKILLYYWNRNCFNEMKELIIDEIPKSISWMNFNNVMVSSKNGYTKIDIRTAKNEEIIVNDRLMNSQICSYGKNGVICATQSGVVFYKDDQNLSTVAVSTDEPTISLATHYPWTLAGSSVGLFVIAPDYSYNVLQKISSSPILGICSVEDVIFAVSSHSLSLLRQTDLHSIISSLHQSKQLNLALALLENASSLPPEDLANYRLRITSMQAYEMFCNSEFLQAIEKFQQSKIDPLKVIALYPDLLPSSVRRPSTKIFVPPDLSGPLLIDAYRALVPYLTSHRSQALSNEPRDLKLLSILDTVLLKTYLNTSPSMVSSLLRLKENFCIESECEKILQEHGKIEELVILFKRKGKHAEALSLLSKQGDEQIEDIIKYLGQLDEENFHIVLSFGGQLVRSKPNLALILFTSEGDAEAWPKYDVYEMFKENCAPATMRMSLLEFYVNEWNCDDQRIYSYLIEEYRNSILEVRDLMLVDTIKDRPESSAMVPNPDTLVAVDELNILRKKLIALLESKSIKVDERLLDLFADEDWIEERALLLSRLGRHKQALHVYADKLPQRAESYCSKIHNSCPEIYGYLLEYLIENDFLDEIFGVLERHALFLPPKKVIDVLPDNVPISEVSNFVSRAITKSANVKRRVKIQSALMEVESTRTNVECIEAERTRIELPQGTRCAHCGRSVNPQSAIAITPSRDVYHYGCLNDLTE